MAFSRPPTATAEFNDGASGSAYQLTLDIAAASLVAIMGKSDDGPTAPDTWTISSIVDDSPDAGAWSVIAYSDSGSATQQTRIFAAWKYFPTGGSGIVIDATISANRQFRRGLGAVYPAGGVGATLEDFDTDSSSTNATNMDAGVVDALTGDLVLGFINKYGFGGTFTPDAGFDIGATQSNSAARPSFIIDRIIDSDGTFTVGGTNTSSFRYAGIAATFRVTPGGAGNRRRRLLLAA